ncbi:MAG: hypothetical protein ACE5OR_07850 [bacterium]
MNDEDELTEALLLCSPPLEKSIFVGDSEIILAIGGMLKESIQTILNTVAKLTRAYFQLFGGLPARRVLMVFNSNTKENSWDGGVFGCSVSILMGNVPEGVNKNVWAPFMAHEIFHI